LKHRIKPICGIVPGRSDAEQANIPQTQQDVNTQPPIGWRACGLLITTRLST
jgi:hypothetical protein